MERNLNICCCRNILIYELRVWPHFLFFFSFPCIRFFPLTLMQYLDFSIVTVCYSEMYGSAETTVKPSVNIKYRVFQERLSIISFAMDGIMSNDWRKLNECWVVKPVPSNVCYGFFSVSNSDFYWSHTQSHTIKINKNK